jgi:hypothetical protein
VPSISELQSAVTQSLEAAVDSMRFASELMARNTAQQQEIERLRELANERLGEASEAKATLRAAAQRKGERPVDVEALADELAACEWDEEYWAASHEILARKMLPILRRHLEPQGEPHERDEVPVRDSAVRVSGVSVEPGVSGASAATAPPRERVEVACGDGRSVESVQAVAAQAVAPAFPARAEEALKYWSSLLEDLHTGACSPEYTAFRLVKAELAALRKQVEEGDKVIDSCAAVLRASKNFGLHECLRKIPLVVELKSYIKKHWGHEWDGFAATPEPKEPANG